MNRPWRAPLPMDAQNFSPAEVFQAGLRNHHISNTAYPIAHERTWKPYRVGLPEHRALVQNAWRDIDDLCLYVHIPFCETRCSFCEYTVVKREELPEMGRYMDALLREFEIYDETIGTRGRTLHGFDIGGGTPSFIPAAEIGRVVDTARKLFKFTADADISIETTPKIAALEPNKIAAYKRMGIGRISMGIQVIQPDLLKILNREENGVREHLQAVENIRAAGFTRFNVDLMYGFQGQTLESWRATLQHAIDLAPEYITLYRMRYKLTRISHQASHVTLEHVRPLMKLAKEMLKDAGFHANPGKTTYSRIDRDIGTSSYLKERVIRGTPYLGLGLGAQTFSHTTISYNDGAVGKNMLPYFRSVDGGRLPLQDLYDLPLRHMAGKMCAVSFYFGEINRAAFEAKFGVPLTEMFADEIDFVLSRGLMEHTEHALSLTPEGAQNVNGVIALFFAPSIQAYLIERDPDNAGDMHRNRELALKAAGAAANV